MADKLPPRIMDEELRGKVLIALQNKDLLEKPCAICGGKFILADGIVLHELYEKSRPDFPSGFAIPCVILMCQKCGFIREHSLGLLGLRDELNGGE